MESVNVFVVQTIKVSKITSCLFNFNKSQIIINILLLYTFQTYVYSKLCNINITNTFTIRWCKYLATNFYAYSFYVFQWRIYFITLIIRYVKFFFQFSKHFWPHLLNLNHYKFLTRLHIVKPFRWFQALVGYKWFLTDFILEQPFAACYSYWNR